MAEIEIEGVETAFSDGSDGSLIARRCQMNAALLFVNGGPTAALNRSG